MSTTSPRQVLREVGAMNLPELGWQWAYSRLAWGIVVAALLLHVWPRVTASFPRVALAVAGLAIAAMGLPGSASPAHWLGLVFQLPSVMLVACCALALLARRTALHVGPVPGLHVTLVIAGGGLVLYADSSGWLHLGLYAHGFDARWGPLAALLAGAWAAWALRGCNTRAPGLTVFACVMVFCLTRLPSGNVFDAFVDPLIWLWCLGLALRAARQRLRRAAPRAAK
jgi:hypothetical protein